MRATVLFFRGLCAALLMGATAPSAAAQAPADCTTVLAVGEESYVRGAFERTRLSALRCLQEGEATRAEEMQAYRLLSLAYLKKGDTSNAYDATAELLRLDPQYRPDAVQDPPSYVTFVAEVREELRAEGRLPPLRPEGEAPWFRQRRTWLAVGGGLIVAGVVAIFAGGN